MTYELTQEQIEKLDRYAKSKGMTYLQLVDAFTDIIYTELQINKFGYFGGKLVEMIRTDIINSMPDEIS